MEDKLLNVKQTAQRLNISVQAVYDWIEEGKELPVIRVGKRYMIRESDVDAYLRKNCKQPTSEVIRKMTKIEKLKSRLESKDTRFDLLKVMHTDICTITPPLFYLTDSTPYPLEVINISRTCLLNLDGLHHLHQQLIDTRLIVFSGCLKEKPKEFNHFTHSTPEEAMHWNKIQWLKGIYKPLRDIDIGGDVADLYGRFLRVKQLWEKGDLFMFEMPAAYVGVGRLVVECLLETLGGCIKAFRECRTREEIESLLNQIDACHNVIKTIAREE